MKVSLDVVPWRGAEAVPADEAGVLYVRDVRVNGKHLHGATVAAIEVDPHGGFLVLRVENTTNVWTPDEYLQGSEPSEGRYLLPVSHLTIKEYEEISDE